MHGSQLMREAHGNKINLVKLWLDLATAYASIPARLWNTALGGRYVPGKIKDLGLNYYCNVRLRVNPQTNLWPDVTLRRVY